MFHSSMQFSLYHIKCRNIAIGNTFSPSIKGKLCLKTALLIIQRATLKNHLKISKQSVISFFLQKHIDIEHIQSIISWHKKQIASGPLMIQIVSFFDYTSSFHPFNLVDRNISYSYNWCDPRLAILIQSLTVYIKCYSISNYIVYLPASSPGYLLEQYC